MVSIGTIYGLYEHNRQSSAWMTATDATSTWLQYLTEHLRNRFQTTMFTARSIPCLWLEQFGTVWVGIICAHAVIRPLLTQRHHTMSTTLRWNYVTDESRFLMHSFFFPLEYIGGLTYNSNLLNKIWNMTILIYTGLSPRDKAYQHETVCYMKSIAPIVH